MTITGSVGSSSRMASSSSSPFIRGMTTSVITREGWIFGTRSRAALPSDAVSTWYPHSSRRAHRPSRVSESSSATRTRRRGRVSGSASYLSALSAWPMVTSGASPVPAGLALFCEPPGPRLVIVHGLEGAQDELPLALFERGAEGQEHGISLLSPLRRGDAQREEDRSDELLVATHHRPLDDVAQLADVAGPRVVAEAHHGRLIHPLDLPSVLLVELRDEGLHEERDVLGPLAQRR